MDARLCRQAAGVVCLWAGSGANSKHSITLGYHQVSQQRLVTRKRGMMHTQVRCTRRVYHQEGIVGEMFCTIHSWEQRLLCVLLRTQRFKYSGLYCLDQSLSLSFHVAVWSTGSRPAETGARNSCGHSPCRHGQPL
ncbi:hypothetical protein BaRGS_00030671 [Batillaria attramentaria]|uniref:Secreted protein n=1 Tax=Batillaria attramentaria TaxID=370345 RepID=A0ABD0JTV9_9CAEN